MVNSEIQERAINLGKALVQELGLENSTDTLSRWMAHYISEQIAFAENAPANEKAEAKQRCFDTILRLWDRRASLPNGRYPFKSFEPIFMALSKLDPDNPAPYYFDNFGFQETGNNGDSEEQNDELQLWINVALSIDAAARVLIEVALQQAAYDSKDEKIVAWLEKSIGISNNYDISIITHLIEDYQQDDVVKEISEKTQKELSSRIEKLDIFIEYSQILRNELIENLELTSNKDSNTTS